MNNEINKLKREEIEVVPYQGIGRIRLGMTEQEVNDVLKNHYMKVHNSSKSIISPPYFNIEYDSKGKAKFIELSRDEDNLIIYPTLFKGIDVFKTKANDLIPKINQYYSYDPNDFELGYSYIYPEIDLALWRPIVFEESDINEDWFKEMCPENQKDEMKHMYFSTVAVGIKGYYSSTDKSEDVMDVGSNKLINNCKITLESYCELKDFEADGPSASFRVERVKK